MMIDQLLEPIYATQKRLNESAHHNLKEYIDQAHRSVQEMVDVDGLSVHYGTRIGGYETVSPPTLKTEQSSVLVDA
jgi:hypothetical protein